MFAILAILAFLAGLFLLATAWLSGHRTIIPAAVKPIWFWVPALILLLGSPIIWTLPSVLTWNTCSNECTLDNPDVREAYDKCVTGGLDSLAVDLVEKEELSGDALTARLDAERPAVEAQCVDGTTNKCTMACFEEWWNPQYSAAETPE